MLTLLLAVMSILCATCGCLFCLVWPNRPRAGNVLVTMLAASCGAAIMAGLRIIQEAIK